MMKHIFQIFGFLVFLWSCGGSNSKNEGLTADYHFEIKDSIQVEYQGNFILIDFEPESGQYPNRNNNTKEYLFYDDQGSILHSFTLQGLRDFSPDSNRDLNKEKLLALQIQ